MRIIFLGTPEFAVPGLRSLVESRHEVVGVVTAPDKPKGRGKQLSISAVKEYALTRNLEILQPASLKDPLFINHLKELNADLFVVIAFRMLPEVVWSMPRFGTFNLHASLLPQYRGAAPIHWAIINGEKETGLTTFFLKHEIDTGDLILQQKEEILDSDTTGSLYIRLMHKGADLVLHTVDLIDSGNCPATPQITNENLHSAPKLTRENTEIDWNKTASQNYNFIRGLNPFPVAWCLIKGNYFKIYESKPTPEINNLKPGEWLIKSNRLYMGCKDQALEITQLQAEGKRRMITSEFLAGNTI